MTFLLYILLGVISGFAAGALGIGGGIIMVPALVLFFGLSQLQAQGTVLTVMLPPILIFAFLRYYQAGNVNIKIAAFIALGFLAGAYFGADFVQGLPSEQLKKVFGILLIIVGIKMVFLK